MKIEHLAIWVNDLELMKIFYIRYFDLTSGKKYVNPAKCFESYFLSFGQDMTRIELMHHSDVSQNLAKHNKVSGLAHFAIAVGSGKLVDQLTERLRSDGYSIAGEPRITGDGYYESTVLDPEGNHIEITSSV